MGKFEFFSDLISEAAEVTVEQKGFYHRLFGCPFQSTLKCVVNTIYPLAPKFLPTDVMTHYLYKIGNSTHAFSTGVVGYQTLCTGYKCFTAPTIFSKLSYATICTCYGITTISKGLCLVQECSGIPSRITLVHTVGTGAHYFARMLEGKSTTFDVLNTLDPK